MQDPKSSKSKQKMAIARKNKAAPEGGASMKAGHNEWMTGC
jgi:hypothetical protein